jgi:hypothetical protein
MLMLEREREMWNESEKTWREKRKKRAWKKEREGEGNI